MTRNQLAVLAGVLVTAAGCRDTQTDLTAPDLEGRTPQSVTALAGTSWDTKAHMYLARALMKAATISGRIYVAGGWTPSNPASSTLQVYDLTSNSWSVGARMPGARYGVNGVSMIDGLLYVAGGVNGSHVLVNTLFVYDPATNSWSQKASMPEAGHCGAQGVISGRLYVYIGCTNTTNGHRFVRYNPATDNWVTLPAPPSRHGLPAAAGVIDGKFYLAGGVTGSSTPNLTHQVYDPATNSWTSRAPLPEAQFGSATGVLDGRLYAAGGEDASSVPIATLRVYRPGSDSWVTKTPMPTARSDAAGAAAGGLFFVVGGFDNGPPFPTDINEAFTPATGETPAPSSASVTVGRTSPTSQACNCFSSDQNGSVNPAVDTVAVNGTVTWTSMVGTHTAHNVTSIGSPSFPSSGTLSGFGATYSATFSAPGTYEYECSIHPLKMKGRVVVR
jgi:plastocyanin/N-acetylneuraminic acid mutarotase